MLNNYKVICNTAAGRRRYMQYLIPFVVANDIVDRYDIWVNTTNRQDIAFFQILQKAFPKINLVYQPDGVVDGCRSISAFYRQCVEEDAIYFRMDDDIVWMEPDMIEKMVRFRIDNPDYFIVSPLVINNPICTYILQNTGKIKLNKYYPAQVGHDILNQSSAFAAQLHEWFLTSQLPGKQYQNLYCGKRPIALNRFSINSILWFGSEMAKFGGIVTGDEEEWMTVIKPTELGAVNCINGDAIAVHFAFYPQRKKLDKLNILNRYGAFASEINGGGQSRVNQLVNMAMREVEERKAELLAQPCILSSKKEKENAVSRMSKWKILPALKLYPLWQIKYMLPTMKYIV